METEGMIGVKPISIRRLKKYYIVRNTHQYFAAVSADDNLLLTICNNREEILKSPNLYINKKILSCYQTYYNRYNLFNDRKLYGVNLCIMPEGLFESRHKITLYSIFDSESSYLKWKLKS